MSDDFDIPLSDMIPDAPHPKEARVIIGQDAAKRDFLDAYNSQKLHHAWMLTGPRGVGKASLAWQFAKFLLTQPLPQSGGMFDEPNPTTVDHIDFDPEHPVIRRMMAGAEPSLSVVRRAYDPKRKAFKSQITVDEIRKLKSFFALRPADGGRRVVILDAADDMNINAANALLKLLEEPPELTTIFLICHQPSRLLPTIRSRCRTLRLAGLSPNDVGAALRAMEIAIDPDQTATITALSHGSVGDAIRLAHSGGAGVYLALLELIAGAPAMDRQSALALASSFGGKSNSDEYDVMISMVEMLLSRLAKTGAMGQVPEPSVSQQERKILEKLSPTPDIARKWAGLAPEISSRLHHGRAVNLDPVSMILDTLFKINDAAAQ